MKKWLTVIGLVALIGIVYGLYEYNRGPRDLSKEKVDVTIDANELFSMFETNESEANTNYLDKVIAVSGTIDHLDENNINLKLENPMNSIACELGINESTEGLKIGKKITVKGQCAGFNLMDVVLVKSVIIK